MSALAIAFKEWAVLCNALAAGRQALILRKGGIAEPDGVFRAEHARFWLYPTFAHQQESGIIDSARPLLDAARAGRPPEGTVRLSHFADVRRVEYLDDLDQALVLAPLHAWSPDAVTARFHYRKPGLFVLAVRVHAAGPHLVHEMTEYAGCKSWVELSEPLDTSDVSAVLDDAAMQGVLDELDRLLQR